MTSGKAVFGILAVMKLPSSSLSSKGVNPGSLISFDIMEDLALVPPKVTLGHESIPTEIWYQILEAVIDTPWVFDTTIGIDDCYWFKKDRFHERKTYLDSEVQRKNLRFVCKAWRSFADEHRWRWLRFGQRSSSNHDDVHDLEAALNHASTGQERTKRPVLPRRLSFGVDSDDAKDLFYKTIVHLSSRLTILFVDCAKRHGSFILEHILANSTAMPYVRCLMVAWADFRETPLQSLSRAFPLLTGLTFLNGVIPHNNDDFLHLSQLESLYIGKVELNGMRPENWRVPNLLRLILPINDGEGSEVTFNLAKAVGANLVFLRPDTYLSHFQVPNDLWRYCPRLTELVLPLSVAELLAPVPVGHPLRYLISKVTIEMLNVDPLRQRFQNNVIALGDGIKAIIMVDLNWEEFIANEERSDAADFVKRLSNLLEAKGVRLEDTNGRALGSYTSGELAQL